MNAPREATPDARFLSTTHVVENQPTAFADVDLYALDLPLREAVRRGDAVDHAADLARFGREAGSAESLELGRLANHHAPELDTHDRFGHRVDLVRFHPAYHAFMKRAIDEGLHSSPWTDPAKGAHVARAAKYYLQAQIEAGHGCPITMTFASVPTLRLEPALAERYLSRVLAREYDPRNVPDGEKRGITVGMAMTEKQGGSDVRANSTRAHFLGTSDGLDAYELVGHKYFVSAPMCDVFLVLAQAEGGLTCFLLPRYRPDGTKNPLQLQRLKRKMGNVSNASSETELRGALAFRVGDVGRGVRTIVEMVAMTRFDCMIGSAAGMRMAVSQAIHHTRHRAAFGRKLVDQPLMTNVLADLALEQEAALAMTMRLAMALDRRTDPHEDALVRLGTAIGKYWICKRSPQLVYEAMECIGGSGVMEDGPMPRLFRESPVNAIWEGSGNVQCLDVVRAVERSPEVVDAFLGELRAARGGDTHLDTLADELEPRLRTAGTDEASLRFLVDEMAIAFAASLLVRCAPNEVADAFCRGRLAPRRAHHYGALPPHLPLRAIVDRALPG